MNEARRKLLSWTLPPGVSIAVHALAIAALAWFGAAAHRALTEDNAPLAEVSLTPLAGTPAKPPRALDDTRPPRVSAPNAGTNAPAYAPRSVEPPALHGLVTAPAAASIAAPSAAGGASRLAGASSSGAAAMLSSPSATGTAASFAGLHARAASRIVYVVDASGAVVTTFTFIRQRLIRSIDRLAPTQQFQVVFFRDLPGDDGRADTIAFDNGDMTRATPQTKARVAKWIDTIQPAGRSEPILGLRAAFDFKPDLVFLLSTRIERTVVSKHAIRKQQSDLLAEIESLNPHGGFSGRRRATIKTVQFINEDPTGLMSRIAAAHGDGPGSFRMLTREELSDFTSARPTPALRADEQVRLNTAVARLGESERDGSTLSVLYGIATPEQRSSAHAAARDALVLLESLKGSSDHRTELLGARTLVLLAATEDDPTRRRALAARAAQAADQRTLGDPRADGARRLTAALAMHLLDEPFSAAKQLNALIADADSLGLDAAARVEAHMARTLALGDDGSLDAELVRSGLASDPRWLLLAGDVAARARLRGDGAHSGAFDRLLALLERPALVANADARRSLVYAHIAAFGDRFDIDWSAQPPEAAFARAITLARHRDQRHEARAMLLAVADRHDAGPFASDALWEAALLAQFDADTNATSAMLQRFARTYPHDPRTGDAVAVAVADARRPDGSLPPGFDTALLAQSIAQSPGRPEADIWRLDIARTQSGDQLLATLEAIAPGTREATLACEYHFAETDRMIAADPADAAPLLERALSMAERHANPAWYAIAQRLAAGIADTHPARAESLYTQLLHPSAQHDLDRDDLTLALARSLITQRKHTEAIDLLIRLADRLETQGKTDDPFWNAWSLALETIAAHGDAPSRAAAAGHIARLRLLDPDLGGPNHRPALEQLVQRLAKPRS